MPIGQVNWGGVAARIVAAVLLVFVTWNPDGVSYWHWALESGRAGGIAGIGPLRILAGIALLIAWFVVLQAARRSLGLLGAVLSAALVGCIIWLLIDWDVVSARSTRGLARAILLVVGVVLGIGLSWSLIRGRLTGQVATDEVG
jgi:hypothetical protein